MFDLDLLTKVSMGFFAFCFLSSSTYVINDIIDVKKDRLHPFKKARPIASGKVSIPEAIVVLIATLSIAYYFSTLVGGFFIGIALVYILLQLSYSFFFKNISSMLPTESCFNLASTAFKSFSRFSFSNSNLPFAFE